MILGREINNHEVKKNYDKARKHQDIGAGWIKDTVLNYRTSRHELIRTAEKYEAHFEEERAQLKHAIPFTGVFIRTIGDDDYGHWFRLGISFLELLKFVETILVDAYFYHKDDKLIDALSFTEKIDELVNSNILKSVSQWENFIDLKREITVTPLEYSETSATLGNRMLEAFSQLRLVVANIKKSFAI